MKHTSREEVIAYSNKIEHEWAEVESVDFSDAESLVRKLKRLPTSILSESPVIQDIIKYTEENSDWDSGEIGNWPAEIREALMQD
ncbi:hypothetical protein [Vibrio owensii]|uniref:hypothetical protein n=1 Tax=Vibrio owensii TaxID=696485 RepID=UPI0018F19564|nr:hypothetical protein [Vibrio owensii]